MCGCILVDQLPDAVSFQPGWKVALELKARIHPESFKLLPEGQLFLAISKVTKTREEAYLFSKDSPGKIRFWRKPATTFMYLVMHLVFPVSVSFLLSLELT